MQFHGLRSPQLESRFLVSQAAQQVSMPRSIRLGRYASCCRSPPATLSALPQIRTGKLRALAVMTKERASVVPQLPTPDSIWPGIDIDNRFAVFVPAGTPPAIVSRLHSETLKAMQHADMKNYMMREGAEVVGGSPAQAREFFSREVEKYAKLVQAAGIKPD
jgi:tripartite-type tricarboxylate transporter receptor subunit TctC